MHSACVIPTSKILIKYGPLLKIFLVKGLLINYDSFALSDLVKILFFLGNLLKIFQLC